MMPTFDYAGLQSDLVDWAFRSGETIFISQTPKFIAYGESQLNRRLALRVMALDVPLVGTIGSRFIDLPADYTEAIALHRTTGSDSIELRPDIAGEITLEIGDGWPNAWCINGDKIQLDRPCDQAHTFVFRYRAKFALSDAAPTNWLLTNHPDVYLAAAMAWGNLFQQNTDEVVKWKAVAEEAIEEIAWKESRSSLSTARVDPALAATGTFNIVSG